MDYHDFQRAIEELEQVEQFVRELAAREDEIAVFGFRRVQGWPSFLGAEKILADFDTRMGDILQFSQAVDRAIWESMKEVAESAKLGHALGDIYVRLKLEMERRPLPTRQVFGMFGRALSMYFPVKPRKLFSDSEIAIQQVLVALHRFIPLAKRAHTKYLQQWQFDDEIFKPSNIDQTIVIQFIENTIVNVQSSNLQKEEKDRLLEYLAHTKVELASNNVSWKKVVGALVIVATLLSGMNDLPGAYENVNKAIQHILGTAVEKHLAPRLPILPMLPDARGGVPA